MLEPKVKLPWKYGSRYYIINEDNEQLLNIDNNPFLSFKDCDYIIQSCNNFPKAIELLKTINNHYNNVENYDWDKKENNIHKIIEEFLNSLK